MSKQNIKQPLSNRTNNNHPPPIVIPRELMLDRSRLKPTPVRVRTPSPLHKANYQHLFTSNNNVKPSSLRSPKSSPSTTKSQSASPTAETNLNVRASPKDHPRPNFTPAQAPLPSVAISSEYSRPEAQPPSELSHPGSSVSGQPPMDHTRSENFQSTLKLSDEGSDSEIINHGENDLDDQVQPWQNQLLPVIGQVSQSDSYTLERANSAAARLDSLARLNGIKTNPKQQCSSSDLGHGHSTSHHTSNEPNENDDSDSDSLPPFLMAKHIEETKRKAALINLANGSTTATTITSNNSSANPSTNNTTNANNPTLLSLVSNPTLYPFTNPAGLGFGVGPNGRGVPRLSALQRKALEKMASSNRDQATGVAPQATSLTRSHTTTCTESIGRLHLTNRLLQPQQPQPQLVPSNQPNNSSFESHQRQEARSNLIRKLSSRGNLGSRPRNPPNATVPVALPTNLPSLPFPRGDPRAQLSRPRPRSGSLNDLPTESRVWTENQPISTSHLLTDQQLPNSSSATTSERIQQTTPSQSTPLRSRQAASSTHSSSTTRASTASELSNFTLNSEFRSYRHSIERDRDSVLDRMGLLDNTLEREINATGQASPIVDLAPRRLSSTRSLKSRRSTSDKDMARSLQTLAPVAESTTTTKPVKYERKGDYHSSNLQETDPEQKANMELRHSTISVSRSRPSSSVRTSVISARSRRSASENLSSLNAGNWIDFSPHSAQASPERKLLQAAAEQGLSGADTHPARPPSITRTNSAITSRIRNRASLSSRIDKSLASGRPTSLISRTSIVKAPLEESSQKTVEVNGGTQALKQAETDKTATQDSVKTDQSPRATKSSISSEAVSGTGDESSYKDRVSRALDEMNRGSIPPLPTSVDRKLKDLEKPLTGSNQAASDQVVDVINEEGVERESGPSQFPPSLNSTLTHMPAASPADLARYNNSKLAPFPALLNQTSPPSSPERSKSPTSLSSKGIRDRSHGILSNASNFFHGNNRNRGGSVSSSSTGRVKSPTKSMEIAKPPSHLLGMERTSEDQEEVADPVRWNSHSDHLARKGGFNDPGVISRTSSAAGSTPSSVVTASSARQEQILARLEPFLRPNLDPARIGRRHSLLSDPPRKLWWHSSVLQVVNATSVKDRYLFLFSDLLVITKPIIEFEDRDGERVPKLPINLNHSFLTKNIVKVQDLSFSNLINDGPGSKQRGDEEPDSLGGPGQHSSAKEMANFVHDFSRNAELAIQKLIVNRQIKDEPSAIGKLLITTLNLDKRKLGDYLCKPEHGGVLKNYLDRLKLAQIRMDDGLRLVLLSLRLPNERDSIERFLIAFGVAWSSANERVGITPSLAARMALGMIVLSEELHHSLHDSMKTVAGCIGYPNGIKSEADFIDSFKNQRDYVSRGGDEDGSASGRKEAVGMSTIIGEDQLDSMLKKLYQSVRRDRLVQARATVEETDPIEISVEGAHEGAVDGRVKGVEDSLPSRLIYQVESDLVTLTIPEPDPQFGIKLFSAGARFEPAFLSFSKSRSCSFRIKGKTIGLSQMSFVKIGARAAAYVGLPLISSILVERAFMKDTVQVAFMNHLQASRKYLFSFDGPKPKRDFEELMARAQKVTVEKEDRKAKSGPQAIGRIASLQVLRDTLIPNEDLMSFNANPYHYTTIELKPRSKLNESSSPHQNSKSESSKKGGNGQGSTRVRLNSLSETYVHTTGKNEKELQEAIIQKRQTAQMNHLKKKQQKILQERMRKNLEGGKQGLNPYSVLSSEREPMIGPTEGIGGKSASESADIIYKKNWRKGEELIKECEQNSLLPLVLGFLSMGIEEVNNLNNQSYSNKGRY